jgi:Rap1a immunity proteins
MKYRAILLLAILWMGSAHEAQAQAKTGNELYDFCSAPSGDYSEGFCYGYIIGVLEMLPMASPKISSDICAKGVTNHQAVDVIVMFLKNNPSIRQYPADVIVGVALEAAFPCKTSVPLAPK